MMNLQQTYAGVDPILRSGFALTSSKEKFGEFQGNLTFANAKHGNLKPRPSGMVARFND